MNALKAIINMDTVKVRNVHKYAIDKVINSDIAKLNGC